MEDGGGDAMIPFASIGAAILKHVPAPVLWSMVGVSVFIGAVWAHGSAVDRFGAAEYARGKRDAQRAVAASDSLLRARLAENQQRAEARTDTAQQSLQHARTRLAPAIAALPAPVAALPEVRLLVVAATAVETTASELRAAAIAERAAVHLRQAADSAEIVRLTVLTHARADTIAMRDHELQKRPTWGIVAGSTILGLIVGFFAHE
ncbi:MAG TPA: hypothetical protein DGD08_01870 [Gemmatimonas aurantiaca]|nr:hypothetical protein [Gemmatimonas aurantiaca]